MQWLKDWWGLAVVLLGWVVAAAFGWAKIMERVNGLGGRVTTVETHDAAQDGRMDRMERELTEYRADAADAAKGQARVEKAVENLDDNVTQGNIQIGSQLHGIERLIESKDKETSNRLVRLETVAQIEKKLGPLPVD